MSEATDGASMDAPTMNAVAPRKSVNSPGPEEYRRTANAASSA